MTYNVSKEDIWKKDLDHFIHPYTDFPSFKKEGSHIITEGSGAYVTDVDGNMQSRQGRLNTITHLVRRRMCPQLSCQRSLPSLLQKASTMSFMQILVQLRTT